MGGLLATAVVGVGFGLRWGGESGVGWVGLKGKCVGVWVTGCGGGGCWFLFEVGWCGWGGMFCVNG